MSQQGHLLRLFPPSGTLEKAHSSTDISDRVGLSSEPSSQRDEVGGFGKQQWEKVKDYLNSPWTQSGRSRAASQQGCDWAPTPVEFTGEKNHLSAPATTPSFSRVFSLQRPIRLAWSGLGWHSLPRDSADCPAPEVINNGIYRDAPIFLSQVGCLSWAPLPTLGKGREIL